MLHLYATILIPIGKFKIFICMNTETLHWHVIINKIGSVIKIKIKN